jgi:hypothetical protein
MEKNYEAFLLEVMVIGEDFGDAFLFHDHHRDTV